MKKSLQNKIKSYTALSAVVAFGASESNAQMISSDASFTGGYESYDVDLDGDGTPELTLMNQQTDDLAAGLFLGGAYDTFGGILGVKAGNGSWYGGNDVYRLSSGSIISAGSSSYSYWTNSNAYAPFFSAYAPSMTEPNVGVLAGAVNYIYNSNIYNNDMPYFGGDFRDEQDAVIGVRFNDANGGTHYGWIRIDVAASGEKYIVRDYGYEAQADIIAYAEANYTSNYVSLGLSDVDNQLNASDLKMRLTLDKTTTHYWDIDGFHTVIAKASKGDLSVPDVLAENGNFIDRNDFTSINADISRFELRLESFQVDSDGDLIDQGVDYNVYVITQDNSGRPMRMVSKSITLTNTLAIAELSNNNVTISSNDGVLNVSLNNVSNATITVNDILGKVILSEKTNASNFTSRLDGATGVYIVTVSNENGKVTKKIKL